MENEDSPELDNITHPFSPSFGLPKLCIVVRAEVGCSFISSGKMRTGQ